MSDERVTRVQELLARYSGGDLEAIDDLVATRFFVYEPAPDEPSATDVYRGYAAELKAAAPDLHIAIPDLAVTEDGTLAGEAIISGTWVGGLWGAAPSGEHYAIRIPARPFS